MVSNKASVEDSSSVSSSHQLHQEQQAKWSLTAIEEPHQNDVIMERGGKANHHPGNKRFLQLIADKKQEYLKLNRSKKTLMAWQITREWSEQNEPGRFLKRDETGLWNAVSENVARKKTSQKLRENAPLLRKERTKQQDKDEGKITSMDTSERSAWKSNSMDTSERSAWKSNSMDNSERTTPIETLSTELPPLIDFEVCTTSNNSSVKITVEEDMDELFEEDDKADVLKTQKLFQSLGREMKSLFDLESEKAFEFSMVTDHCLKRSRSSRSVTSDNGPPVKKASVFDGNFPRRKATTRKESSGNHNNCNPVHQRKRIGIVLPDELPELSGVIVDDNMSLRTINTEIFEDKNLKETMTDKRVFEYRRPREIAMVKQLSIGSLSISDFDFDQSGEDGDYRRRDSLSRQNSGRRWGDLSRQNSGRRWAESLGVMDTILG